MYADRKSKIYDLKESERWLRLGAQGGDAFAQAKLGALYALGLFGSDKPRSDDEASKWCELARKQNYAFKEDDACQKVIKAGTTVAQTQKQSRSDEDPAPNSRSGAPPGFPAATDAMAYKSFFGIPLGESMDFYAKNFRCGGRNPCVSKEGDRTWVSTYFGYIFLPVSSSPAWITGHDTVFSGPDETKVFKPINNMDGVEFVVLKQSGIQELSNKYGQAVRAKDVRTSSAHHKGRRLSENAEILTWKNSAVVAELACFSDEMCDGVIVTQAYWPTYTSQRNNGGKRL